MRLVLDTHTIVWWLVYPERLSRIAHAAISDESNTVLVSAVAGYEIELKRGRDPVLAAVPWDLEAAVDAERFNWLPLRAVHTIQAGRLPMHHRDPWDRVLVAQTQIEDATLITIDAWLAPYGIRTLW